MSRKYDNAFRQEQAALTRGRIVEALIDQLGQGPKDFSAADIAAAAGVSLRTVYQHFPDREAQINAVIAVLEERLAYSENGPANLDEMPAFAERLIQNGAQNVREMRAQIAGGIASEIRARRRRARDRAVLKAVGKICDLPSARLAAAALNVVTSAEISLGLVDRFGIHGQDMINTHAWIVRTLVDAIKRGDVPAPAATPLGET